MEYLKAFNGLNLILTLYHELDNLSHYAHITYSQVPGYYTYSTSGIYETLLLPLTMLLHPMFDNDDNYKMPIISELTVIIAEYITLGGFTFFECLNCSKHIATDIKCQASYHYRQHISRDITCQISYHIPPQTLPERILREYRQSENSRTIYFFFGNAKHYEHLCSFDEDYTAQRNKLIRTVFTKCQCLKTSKINTNGPICSEECLYSYCLNKNIRKVSKEIVCSYTNDALSITIPIVIICLIRKYCNFTDRECIWKIKNKHMVRYIYDKETFIEKYYLSIMKYFLQS